MTIIRFTWAFVFAIGFMGCQRDPDPTIVSGSIKYEIVGSTYPNGVFDSYTGKPTLHASSIRTGFCSYEVVSSQIGRPITQEAQLQLSLNIPSRVRRYTLYTSYHRTMPLNFCSLDSIHVSISVLERPVPGYIDLMGLAAYQVIDDAGSYLEVTCFDEKRRWVEGKFELKAVRIGVMGYPLPLSDTLVITKGKFSFGFKRE